ncbi:hypothetical protein Hanom_Chr07g00607501 [Helianthus anomalus]
MLTSQLFGTKTPQNASRFFKQRLEVNILYGKLNYPHDYAYHVAKKKKTQNRLNHTTFKLNEFEFHFLNSDFIKNIQSIQNMCSNHQ